MNIWVVRARIWDAICHVTTCFALGRACARCCGFGRGACAEIVHAKRGCAYFERACVRVWSHPMGQKNPRYLDSFHLTTNSWKGLSLSMQERAEAVIPTRLPQIYKSFEKGPDTVYLVVRMKVAFIVKPP